MQIKIYFDSDWKKKIVKKKVKKNYKFQGKFEVFTCLKNLPFSFYELSILIQQYIFIFVQNNQPPLPPI